MSWNHGNRHLYGLVRATHGGQFFVESFLFLVLVKRLQLKMGSWLRGKREAVAVNRVSGSVDEKRRFLVFGIHVVCFMVEVVARTHHILQLMAQVLS